MPALSFDCRGQKLRVAHGYFFLNEFSQFQVRIYHSMVVSVLYYGYDKDVVRG